MDTKGPLWYATKFGQIVSVTFGNGYDPKAFGADLFGRTGKLTTLTGVVMPFVVADYSAHHLTLMSCAGLSYTGGG